MSSVQAAVVVPSSVEKLPLFHWRPGERVLMVGSRDGASFDGQIPTDEQRSYQRSIDNDFITTAAQRFGVDAWCANWSASLAYAPGMDMLCASALKHRCVITSGYGDPDLLTQLLPRIDAWVLLIADHSEPAPLTESILQGGKHVEVVIGCSGSIHPQLQGLAWQQAAAIHLQPQRPSAAVGRVLQEWERSLRSQLPSTVAIYDSQQQCTICPSCGAELIWRYGGRSRIDQWRASDSCCGACGQPITIRM